jgi:DNA-binding ferritin-like protein
MRLFEAKQIQLNSLQKQLVQESICSVLCMVTQAHVWHWQTKKYSQHEALGDFYENLQEQVDELAEIFMGVGGDFMFTEQKEITNFMSIEDVVDKVEDFKQQLVNAQAELMKDENAPLHSAGDSILTIVQETDKLLYLLGLE